MKKLEIYTDGSCKGNPGPGGWTAIILEPKAAKPLHILKGGNQHTTNNRMEMMGIIEALKWLDQKKYHQTDVTLYSDSNLIIQTLLQGWKKKANQDLWKELDAVNEKFSIKYQWVKGHAKNKWNNECDRIAQKEADLAAAYPERYPAGAQAQKAPAQQRLL